MFVRQTPWFKLALTGAREIDGQNNLILLYHLVAWYSNKPEVCVRIGIIAVAIYQKVN